ncbi:SRPBCC family protein [uncultured Paludibaculum sp.]|uniref:SRPBCC family protein n=1 Tax=uncultured Paludibaculum sp. TaxID=1765020 RepID=UPI002AAB17DD|nr:SRPBCC family protein [uncultured Paludibaculum sp.]
MKKILAILAALLVVVLLWATTRPDRFQVERSADMQAPPEKIIAFIEDFHQWGAWSPFEKLDPEMKRTFSGAEKGKGAVYEWVGNSEAGTGRMEIADIAPGSKVTIQLDFTKPFEAHNIAEFTLVPVNGTTRVTWSMRGPQPYVAKLIGLFMSMDSMVGKNFETGLVNLKSLAEK